jgi:hypothetical protein
MAKTKTKRPRGQVKSWVQEARNAGKKKAKDIAAFIKEKHHEEVRINQIYGVVMALKAKPRGNKGNKSNLKYGTLMTAVAQNGDAVSLILGVKALAKQAGGFDRLIEVAQAMR